jgi:uncharacterized protein YndB with AHSA1/START domain
MQQSSVVHSTIVIRRNYPATPEKIFAALSDPAKKVRWFAEAHDAQKDLFEMDFRVGGIERTRRQNKEGWVFTNDTVYRDIVLNKRVVLAYNMSVGEKCISSSLATFELLPGEKGTDLVFTDQIAFYEGADGPQMREEGWRKLLEKLGEFAGK